MEVISINAKEYLGQARAVETLLRVKRGELAELQKQINGYRAQDVKVKTSSVCDRMKIVDAIVDYRKEILREISVLIRTKKEIRQKINQLSKPLHVGMLTEYYINNKSWSQIADILHMSERHVYRVHGNALNEFRKKFDME